MAAKRLQQRELQFGIISSWSLRVPREARLVSVLTRRTPAAGQLPHRGRSQATFRPQQPSPLRKKAQVFRCP